MMTGDELIRTAKVHLGRALVIHPRDAVGAMPTCPAHLAIGIDERPANCPRCVEDMRLALRYHIALNQQLHGHLETSDEIARHVAILQVVAPPDISKEKNRKT